MLKKLDTITAGLIIGIVIPAILYFAWVHPKLSLYRNIEGYANLLAESLPLFLTRCIFPNALVFFLLVWRNQLKISKGLLISTSVLTAALVILNFAFKA